MDFKATLATLGNTDATVHWLLQRISAVLLIPLSYWLIVLLNLMATAPYQTTVDWLTAPRNAVALSAWIVLVFYHAALGVQVVLEDYVSDQTFQKSAIRASNGLFGLFALVGLAALFKIILAG
jgi:succinate dehydrogenase / fumarate reductase, membrane anchor subunit